MINSWNHSVVSGPVAAQLMLCLQLGGLASYVGRADSTPICASLTYRRPLILWTDPACSNCCVGRGFLQHVSALYGNHAPTRAARRDTTGSQPTALRSRPGCIRAVCLRRFCSTCSLIMLCVRLPHGCQMQVAVLSTGSATIGTHKTIWTMRCVRGA